MVVTVTELAAKGLTIGGFIGKIDFTFLHIDVGEVQSPRIVLQAETGGVLQAAAGGVRSSFCSSALLL